METEERITCLNLVEVTAGKDRVERLKEETVSEVVCMPSHGHVLGLRS